MEIDGSLATSEFIAVVLTGFGNGLSPLTRAYGDEPCPKALLPIANKPMIEYALTWIDQSGIRDVLLICPASHRAAIYHHIHSDTSSSASGLHIDLQTLDETPDATVGTCAMLRHFSNRISKPFVVLPCDFVPPTTVSLSVLLDKFRSTSTSSGSIATAFWVPVQIPDGPVPEEWGPSSPPHWSLWHQGGTLVQTEVPDDIDRNPQNLEISLSLLNRYPRLQLSKNYSDSHIYVCSRLVLDLLHLKRHMESLTMEFIPWLCSLSYDKRRRMKSEKAINLNISTQSAALSHSTLQHEGLHPTALSPNRTLHPAEFSVPTSPVESEVDEQVANLGIDVVHLHDFAIRANTIQAYLEANKWFLSRTTPHPATDSKSRSLIDVKAQISVDTIIGEFSQIAERTSIKRTVVGRHCIIGKMVKIVGSVILDHCVIEDGAKIEHCILGKNTKVRSKAELSRCITQAGYEIHEGESLKGEKLEISDWTSATGGNDTDGDSDS
ncbi:UDP-3-O-glucosamine N-acyltransferase [Pluteus cervinus]|uniref:UDP-3-O-glucosamine N-acyltransferase n=1 Tax=Pluteus cervinus TaxID=181527 RepID=A0ACD3BBQ2_9AGAR|nr:UDP-3-O-glucosamine N-acyltransferase [Pluteus cervinus]